MKHITLVRQQGDSVEISLPDGGQIRLSFANITALTATVHADCPDDVTVTLVRPGRPETLPVDVAARLCGFSEPELRAQLRQRHVNLIHLPGAVPRVKTSHLLKLLKAKSLPVPPELADGQPEIRKTLVQKKLADRLAEATPAALPARTLDEFLERRRKQLTQENTGNSAETVGSQKNPETV